MYIGATNYSLSMKSFDIFVSGCNPPHCRECYNPILHSFNVGEIYSKDFFDKNIRKKIIEFDMLVENIMIFGGEPLDQPIRDLEQMLKDLKTLGKKIWLFTKYSIEKIPKNILVYCDYIKSGRYIKELETQDNIQYGVMLATSNQKIYKVEDYLLLKQGLEQHHKDSSESNYPYRGMD